jgi:hypothetical protein
MKSLKIMKQSEVFRVDFTNQKLRATPSSNERFPHAIMTRFLCLEIESNKNLIIPSLFGIVDRSKKRRKTKTYFRIRKSFLFFSFKNLHLICKTCPCFECR